MALEVSRVLAGAHDDPILCVAYNAVRREVWTGCQGGKIRCWEEKTGEMVQEVSGAHKGWVTAMEYVRRHDYLVTCGVDGTMVCRTEKGKELQRVDARGALFCLAYGARRDLLVAGGRGAISVFRLVTINTVERNKDPVDRRVHPVRLVCTVPDVHADVIRGVACDASGRIFTGSYDRSVCVFDGEQFERMRSRDADEPAASVPPRDPPRYRRWAEAHDAAVSVVATVDGVGAAAGALALSITERSSSSARPSRTRTSPYRQTLPSPLASSCRRWRTLCQSLMPITCVCVSPDSCTARPTSEATPPLSPSVSTMAPVTRVTRSRPRRTTRCCLSLTGISPDVWPVTETMTEGLGTRHVSLSSRTMVIMAARSCAEALETQAHFAGVRRLPGKRFEPKSADR